MEDKGGFKDPVEGVEDAQEKGEAVHPAPVGDEEKLKTTPAEGEITTTKCCKKKGTIFWGVFIFCIVAVGLGVGLGVGLTRDQGTDSAASSQTTAGDKVERGDIQEAGIGDLTMPTVYQSTPSDPVPFEMSSFGTQVLQPYGSCDELSEDLTQAARQLASIFINRYAHDDYKYWIEEDEARPTEADGDMGAPPAESAPSAAKGETAYETNVQVKGVDEADIVKSDGERVFAAYGDKVVVWNARTGKKVSETLLPEIPFDDSHCKDDVEPSKPPIREPDEVDSEEKKPNEDDSVSLPTIPPPTSVEETKKENESGASVSAPAGVSTGTTDSVPAGASAKVDPDDGEDPEHTHDESEPSPEPISDMPPRRRHCWRPKARVEGLILHKNRLAVFATGYKDHQHTEESRILENYGSVQVLLYATDELISVLEDGGKSTRTEMKFIASEDLPGNYQEGRAVGADAYAITKTRIDTWEHFERYFCRHCYYGDEEERQGPNFQGLEVEEYIEQATDFAIKTVIPNFVKRFVSELDEREGGDCSNIARVSVFQTGDVAESAAAENWWGNQGILGGIAQVSSFSLETVHVARGRKAESGKPKVAVQTSSAFVPDTWGNIYATANKLFITGNGYDQHPNKTIGYVETTFFYMYDLVGSGGVAKAVGVGKVAGQTLNQFSMDLYEGHLRVATTIPEKWGCANQASNGEDEDGTEKMIMWCEQERIRDPANQVTILQLPGDDSSERVMTAVGQAAGLGKPGESITAVRFVNEMGFVVTFERTDPFVVLNLKDPRSPKVLYNLEISGYSSYLHPTEDGKTIIAVGQDATAEGRVTGLQITLFDVSNKNKPDVLDRFNFEEINDPAWSTSEVEADHKAFRYSPDSNSVILPATIHGRCRRNSDGEESTFFDGFYIFEVDPKKNRNENIKLRFKVNLADPEEYCGGKCYSDGHLQARSMIFDGRVTLMKSHAVKSYDLEPVGEDPILFWELDLDENVPKDQCYGYWD